MNAFQLFSGISRRKLQKLLQVVPAIISESNIEKLLQQILQNTTEVMEAERSSIFILDAEKNELWTFVTEGGDTREIRISADRGIVGAVVRDRETINIRDAYHDPRFEISVDQKTGFRTRAIMAMPIMGRSHQVIGVLEVLNKKSWRRIFTDKDEKLLQAFCSLVAISLENSMQVIHLQQNLESLSRYSTSLERYIGAHILTMLKKGEDPVYTSAASHQRAVLFCDIRNFTSISKDLSAEDTVSYLNRFFIRLHRAISEHGGIIEKIMGDSVMASFTDCNEALLCSENFTAELHEHTDIKCGIGLTWGEVLVGNIGSSYKLDYTLVGSIVNLAARLEKTTKKAAVGILMSEEFREKLSPENREKVRKAGRIRIRGFDRPVTVYGY